MYTLRAPPCILARANCCAPLWRAPLYSTRLWILPPALGVALFVVGSAAWCPANELSDWVCTHSYAFGVERPPPLLLAWGG